MLPLNMRLASVAIRLGKSVGPIMRTPFTVTIWSGLDAQKNPGTAAVRADCAGQGTSCPEYQQGLSAQLRTNILLAATGGVAALTAVTGLFLTQWSHADRPRTGLQVEPQLGLGVAALKGTF